MSVTIGYVRRLAIPTALALALGCGTNPTAPAALQPHLQLTLSVSSTTGAPGSPVTARASVRNTGRLPVWYLRFCSGNTPEINVWESDHHNIEELCGCPNIVCTACAGEPASLKPGETIQVERTFDGKLHTCDGPYDVADGDVTVELLFSGRPIGQDGALFTLTRSAVIHWSAH